MSESSSDESVTNDVDVEEIDERHEVQLLTSPNKHHVEVVATTVPKIKIEDLEDEDIATAETNDVITEAEVVALETVDKVVRFDDDDDVGDRNVLKKSLSTVDIANEIMKEIRSKVNFCEDGSILTNDSDARDQYYNTFFSKLMRPFINLQRLKEAIGFPDWFPIQQKAKLFRS